MSTVQDATDRFSLPSLFSCAFGSGPRWLAWLVDTVAASLDLSACQRDILALRQQELPLREIAVHVGLTHRQTERSSGQILARARERGCATIPAVALQALVAAQTPPVRLWMREIDPERGAAWQAAVESFGRHVVSTAEFDAADVAICSPWQSDWHRCTEPERVVVLSSPDRAGRLVCTDEPTRMCADPGHDDLPLVLAHAIVRAAQLWAPAVPRWPLPSAWLRRALLAHVVARRRLNSRAYEVVDTWIDAGDQKSIARRLHLSKRAVESRASLVCAALHVQALTGVPLGAAQAMPRLEPTQEVHRSRARSEHAQ